MADHCARCGQEFDPNDKAFDGSARYQETKFCRRCVDRCHEATEFDHTCLVCQSDSWTESRTPCRSGCSCSGGLGYCSGDR